MVRLFWAQNYRTLIDLKFSIHVVLNKYCFTEHMERLNAAESLGVDPSHLQHLMEMGFPLEMCIEALVTTSNLLLATDYLLSNGWTTEGGSAQTGGSQVC